MDEDDDQYDFELVRFVFDLRKEDPLQMLVRARAHIEQSLRQFILVKLRIRCVPQDTGTAWLQYP